MSFSLEYISFILVYWVEPWGTNFYCFLLEFLSSSINFSSSAFSWSLIFSSSSFLRWASRASYFYLSYSFCYCIFSSFCLYYSFWAAYIFSFSSYICFCSFYILNWFSRSTFFLCSSSFSFLIYSSFSFSYFSLKSLSLTLGCDEFSMP